MDKRRGFSFIFVVLTSASALAADLTVAAGIFRFPATDYYYPNFYTEMGFRGEFALGVGAVNRSTVRLLVAGYPMDDNIFDPAAEYAYRRKMTLWGWDVLLEPAAGFQYTKLQYPAPYYPTVTHNFMPWVRLGGDAGVGHHLVGPLALAGRYRVRALYYLGDKFFINDDGDVEPWKYVHGPVAELALRLNERWTALARGGWEFGGYYDAIFMTPEELLASRPSAEAGFTYSF